MRLATTSATRQHVTTLLNLTVAENCAARLVVCKIASYCAQSKLYISVDELQCRVSIIQWELVDIVTKTS